MKLFPVKLCPICKSVWETVRNFIGKNDKIGMVKHGTDWPMKSHLQKRICFDCKTSEREAASSGDELILNP